MKGRLLSKYDGKKHGWLKDTKKFLLLLFVVFLLFQLVIGFSAVKGNSMEPTLSSGELVLYSRYTKEYQRGDVVSVRIPSGEYYVKRIIAVEGDTIDIRDGKVYLNDKLLDEPYIQGITETGGKLVDYPCTLTENQVFVMGDNREISDDSRSFGPVNVRQIKGKLWFYGGWFYIRKLY